MQKLLLAISLTLGGLTTYVDTRPTWDDTGVTATAILITCGVLGFSGPRRPWLWALAVGFWIPLFGIFRTQSFATLLALVVAFAGAYAGMALRTGLRVATENRGH